MSFKTLCLYAFFIIWQNILLIHILIYTMSVLIAGHSQTKYFHKYLPPGYKVSSHSGAHIQQLWGKICSTITNFACVVLVIGTNNLPSDPTITILDHYQTLVQNIRKHNPRLVLTFFYIIFTVELPFTLSRYYTVFIILVVVSLM